MPPPNLPTLGTKIKCVIARWVALPIMKDSVYSLTFAKATAVNIIKVAAKSPCTYSPTNLKRLNRRLGAKNKCRIEEVNRTSLIYLRQVAITSFNNQVFMRLHAPILAYTWLFHAYRHKQFLVTHQ